MDTFRLGRRTNAIKATHRPMPMAVTNRELTRVRLNALRRNVPSIRSQCPVRIQTQTIVRARLNDRSSAPVNRPQNPKENLIHVKQSLIRLDSRVQNIATDLFPDVHGRLMYWHIGSSKKARATVAITANKREDTVSR